FKPQRQECVGGDARLSGPMTAVTVRIARRVNTFPERCASSYGKMEENNFFLRFCVVARQYGIKKKEEAEAEAQAAMEAASEGSLTRPKKAVPSGCGDEDEEEESIMDTVMKYLPGPLQDMLKK
uniref:Complexin 2, like n=1 Tax=Astyanax mexicanus TaxID=7994 RepID=A0A8B9HJV3_ASTMX